MTYTWEALLKLEYGNPITPSMVEKIHGTGTDYYKIGWNKYILGWELEDEEYKIFYTGFLWVASERILRLDDLDADKVHVTPPEILLPKPGMSSYPELVEYGKKVDPEHFIDVVIRYRMVMFNDFIYCFRKAFPSESDHLIQIEVNRKRRTVTNSLILAVGKGNYAEVKRLLEAGADINFQTEGGKTALMYASLKENRIEIVKLLLENGADVNAQENHGATALMNASYKGLTDIAKLLIDNGADVNAQEKNGGTALMLASSNGHTDIAKLLIDKGADVNAQRDPGYSPFYSLSALAIASFKGHREITELLKEAGAKE